MLDTHNACNSKRTPNQAYHYKSVRSMECCCFPTIFCSYVEWFLNYRLSRHSVLFSRCNLNCKIFCFHCAFSVMHGVAHCMCIYWRRHCNKTMRFSTRIMPESLNVTMNTNNLHKVNVIEHIYTEIMKVTMSESFIHIVLFCRRYDRSCWNNCNMTSANYQVKRNEQNWKNM